jgi:hypothetical protein
MSAEGQPLTKLRQADPGAARSTRRNGPYKYAKTRLISAANYLRGVHYLFTSSSAVASSDRCR